MDVSGDRFGVEVKETVQPLGQPGVSVVVDISSAGFRKVEGFLHCKNMAGLLRLAGLITFHSTVKRLNPGELESGIGMPDIPKPRKIP